MNYINEQTMTYPVSERDIRTMHTNTSFPEPFTAPAHYALVFAAPQPEHDPLRQVVREIAPVKTAKGHWEQVWIVETLPTEAVEVNLSSARATQREAIKARREIVKTGGVKMVVNGMDKWFHTDDPSRIQQIGLVMMGANLPAGLQWKTMDGSFVTMTQVLAGQVFQANAAHDQAAFAVAENHRSAMEASERPDLYDFSSSWPVIFSEA